MIKPLKIKQQNKKHMIAKIIYSFIFSLLTVSICLADRPLKIKSLLEKKELRLELGLGFSNTSKFMPRQNTDDIDSVLGLRYGITAKTEIYSHLTVRARIDSIQNNAEAIHSYQWKNMVLGINHRFATVDDGPIFLGFANISVEENSESKIVYRKTGTIGFTMYDSIDPVVPSLTVAYNHVGDMDIDGSKFDPGDSLSINPSLGFAINNEITVTGGVAFGFTGKDTMDGHTSSIRTSQTHLSFGVGYQASEELLFNFNISADISGNDSAHAGLNLLYNL